MLFIDKIESNEFNLDFVILKSGQVLGIDNDQVVLYASMQDFEECRTIDRQSIDLSIKLAHKISDYAKSFESGLSDCLKEMGITQSINQPIKETK
jgi:hypothetical protein